MKLNIFVAVAVTQPFRNLAIGYRVVCNEDNVAQSAKVFPSSYCSDDAMYIAKLGETPTVGPLDATGCAYLPTKKSVKFICSDAGTKWTTTVYETDTPDTRDCTGQVYPGRIQYGTNETCILHVDGVSAVAPGLLAAATAFIAASLF